MQRFARVVLLQHTGMRQQHTSRAASRQFVDAMSVANTEDDGTWSICSVALELRDELKDAKLTRNSL